MNLLLDGPTVVTDLQCCDCGKDWHVPLTAHGLRFKPDNCPPCFAKSVNHAVYSEYTYIFKYGKAPT